MSVLSSNTNKCKHERAPILIHGERERIRKIKRKRERETLRERDGEKEGEVDRGGQGQAGILSSQ